MPKPISGRPQRVVVDTNGWISSFITPQSAVAKQLRQLLSSAKIELLFSSELRQEISSVLQRPKFSKYISPEKRRLYEEELLAYALTTVSTVVEVCRDPNDNFLLALCHDGQADFLVTGDRDLLILAHFGRTRILTWAEAETILAL